MTLSSGSGGSSGSSIDTLPQVHWTDNDGTPQQAGWRSLAGHPPPRRLQLADDTLGADAAYRLLDHDTAILWLGDYQNARHLLQALGRRLDKRQQQQRPAPPSASASLTEAFQAQRQAQLQRARILGGLLLPFDADHGVPLRRAPDLRAAGLQAHGPVAAHYVQSLRELMGLVGAFEWRRKGVPVAALGARIHPHHGVFSPLRGEYVDLVAKAPLPAAAQAEGAFDIGTGTGVLAAVLARRGLRVTATDLSPAALACAADNLRRLGQQRKVTVLSADLFPAGRAGLVLCNPPWVPAPAGSEPVKYSGATERASKTVSIKAQSAAVARATASICNAERRRFGRSSERVGIFHRLSALETAVYDPDSRMLRGFLAGLAAHLAPSGEGWLILSDIAEHLGLRSREELLGWISAAGLQVLGRLDTKPVHQRAADASDPLHAARAAEITSLWRLGAA